jgi:hypothetical protein
MFLGQYVSAPMQETIAYLKLSYEGLAHEMSVPEMVLRDPVDGKMTRGQWSGLAVCWVWQQLIAESGLVTLRFRAPSRQGS